MTSLSDTLTVGLVLVLLFGSIALYLYTRIQQAEQKISLLESILLDLKMSAEVKSYSELPAESVSLKMGGGATTESYAPFDDEDDDEGRDAVKDSSDNYFPDTEAEVTKSGNSTPSVSESLHDTGDVEQYKSVIAEAVKDETESEIKISANYEAMTIKELQTLAKSRGITGAGSMKKNAIIEALKTSDRSSAEPGPSTAGTSAFLETSSSFQSSGGSAVESQ
jgi:hypothetical protein